MILAKKVTNESDARVNITLGNGIQMTLEAGESETDVYISESTAKDSRLKIVQNLNEVC